MLNQILFYSAAGLTVLWGVAHLFPTASVVRGFGNISEDNKNIVYMEWITEGITLIFTGILIAGTALSGTENNLADFVYILSIFLLLTLAVVSLFTGFKINFLPYKLCPFIFGLSALLIFLGISV